MCYTFIASVFVSVFSVLNTFEATTPCAESAINHWQSTKNHNHVILDTRSSLYSNMDSRVIL